VDEQSRTPNKGNHSSLEGLDVALQIPHREK
jgi:hypothetical protein